MEQQRRWEKISSASLLVFSGGIFIVFFVLSLRKAGVIADSDEALFHFPNVMNFYENGWAALFNEKYSAANTPLPYILVAAAGKCFGTGLWLARIMTALFSFGAFYFALRIIELSEKPAYYALVIFFYPYFFNNSFVFYVINYGLFFTLWAFYLLKKRASQPSYATDLLTGILLTLAVLCQQFYLIIPFAIILYRFTHELKNGSLSTKTSGRRFLVSSSLLCLPMVLPVALFLQWGGLTHPNFHAHSLSFYPSTLVAILFVTGFYLFLYAWQQYKQFRVLHYAVAAIVAGVGVWWFRPVFSDLQGPGLFTGIAFRVITLTGKLAAFLPAIAMFMLCFTGILVVIALWRRSLSHWEKMTGIALFLLALGYASNTQIGERHLLGWMILLFLLILPGFKKPFITGQIGWMALVGIGYFFYWNFFKFN
jgi:hypothetical protein